MKVFGQRVYDQSIQKALRKLRSGKIPYLEWREYTTYLSNDIYVLTQNDSYFELAKALVEANIDFDIDTSIYVLYLENVDKETRKKDREEKVAKEKEELSRFIEATESIANESNISKSRILFDIIKRHNQEKRLQGLDKTSQDPQVQKEAILKELFERYPGYRINLGKKDDEDFLQPDDFDNNIGEHRQGPR